ncbi:OmpA family protein [Sphingomonas sp. LB-2]|uniref:OmpA family protein n=1 Tax=Sphingomonas caeni TaxID=2984949 RepID=UPI00223193FF|nr:OmpA family protein [Sphingomonas caeni]MCW3846960.1 OmpA family protein [Sphingomonas caeni]
MLAELFFVPPAAPVPAAAFCTSIFFDPDSAEIPRSAWPILDRVVSDVEDNGGAPVAITGNSGATRFPGGAQALATARAQHVRDYLIRQGVNGGTITIRSPDPAWSRPENKRLANALDHQNAEICVIHD